jgi:uncharacterized protein
MQTPQDAILLRTFIGEADRAEGRALYRAIVEAARTAGLAGATVLHGQLSFGPDRRINSNSLSRRPGTSRWWWRLWIRKIEFTRSFRGWNS